MKTEDVGTFQPLPFEQREAFALEVPIGAKPQRGLNHRKVEVLALETCCEYLYIHPSVSMVDEWTVTHKITGYAMAQYLPSEQAARYVAGGLSLLFRFSENHMPYYKARLEELPAEIRGWISNLRFP